MQQSIKVGDIVGTFTTVGNVLHHSVEDVNGVWEVAQNTQHYKHSIKASQSPWHVVAADGEVLVGFGSSIAALVAADPELCALAYLSATEQPRRNYGKHGTVFVVAKNKLRLFEPSVYGTVVATQKELDVIVQKHVEDAMNKLMSVSPCLGTQRGIAAIGRFLEQRVQFGFRNAMAACHSRCNKSKKVKP